MSKLLFLLLFWLPHFFLFYGQQIKGTFTAHAGQRIALYKYIGTTSQIIDSAEINEGGEFRLKIPKTYLGMGYLKTNDNSFLNLILNGQDIFLKGKHLKELTSIIVSESIENQMYYQYLRENPQRENILTGWKYLLQEYSTAPLFKENDVELKIINQQIESVENQDEKFISSLDQSSYTSYILPIQKLVRDIPMSAKHFPEKIPQHIKAFQAIDYKDIRLYHSGLLDDVIQGQYWLIENSGLSLDSIFVQMNLSTDYLIENLQQDEKILNEVTEYLFDLLEKHSLFRASEYLALKVLTQNSCTLNDDLANQLETYRAMKIGNQAEELLLTGLSVKQGLELSNQFILRDISAKYKLVMFGASWCPKCTHELPKVKSFYQEWKQKGLDVIFISLDNNKEEYLSFVKDFPWISTCDFQGWNTKAAKDYYVFSTPTLFLLDHNNKIILRPNSIAQVNAWVGYYLN